MSTVGAQSLKRYEQPWGLFGLNQTSRLLSVDPSRTNSALAFLHADLQNHLGQVRNTPTSLALIPVGKIPMPRTVPPAELAPIPTYGPPSGGGANAGWAGIVLKGLAAGVGAYIGYNAPDWYRLWQYNRQPPTTVFENNCKTENFAQSYLENLQRDEVDQRLKSIPPRTYEWRMPNGYGIQVKQGWGKDGLAFNIKLSAPDGSVVNKEVKVRAELTQKGVKIPLLEAPLVIGSEDFGKLNLDLRVNGQGLNEVGLTYTSYGGYVTKIKLKPNNMCGLDITSSKLLRMNQGSQADAKKWAEVHLAESARRHQGNIYPGLLDLFVYMQPSASGLYRNHGSAVLDVLTNALNRLQAAGVDSQELQQIQMRAKNSPYGSAEYKKYRNQMAQWLQHQLSAAIDSGKIDPKSMRNPYEINFGISKLAQANQNKEPALRSDIKLFPPRPAVSIDQHIVAQVVGNQHVVRQTRSGDLFIAMPFVVDFKNNPEVQALLKRLAGALGVEPQQIEWQSAKLTIGGVQSKGILLKVHLY